MRGKCAFPDCFVGDDEELSTEDCSFCTKPVHHMCSNAVCEGELTLRECSASCANALGLVKHPLTSATTSKPRSSSAKEAVLKPVAKTHTKKAITKRKANGSNIDSSDDAPAENRANKPKKFFFTPAADLALLREMLDVQPYAANHGSNTARYQNVTDHLNEHLETELGIRTVKEHFLLLVKEFKATDCEYRKKSGVAEEYSEHKQLLQNITVEMRDLETKKRKKRKADQDKSDRLESAGAKLREQALKRRCQRGQTHINDESDASNDSSQESSTTAEVETTSTSSKTIEKAAGVTTAQVNMAAVSFIEGQHKRRDDEFELLREELRFKQAKAEREEARWKADMEFRQHEADRKAKKSTEDAELRRTEFALRREELAVLKHQLGIQRLPNGAQQTFV